MQTRPLRVGRLGIINLHLLLLAANVEAQQEVSNVGSRAIGLRVGQQQVEDGRLDRLPNATPSTPLRSIPLAQLEIRLGHVVLETLHDAVEDAQGLGGRLQESHKAVEFVAPLLGELLRHVKQGRLGDDGEHLHREQGNLVLLLAADEQRNLHDDLRVVEERLVDLLHALQAIETVLRDGEGRLGEGGYDDLEEGRLQLEGATEDAHASKHACGEKGRAGKVGANRVVAGREDGDHDLEEGGGAEQSREEVEAGVEEEVRERRGGRVGGAAARSSRCRPGEEGSQVEADEGLLHKLEADVGDGPPLLLVAVLPLARLEQDVLDDKLDVGLDAGRALRCAEVVGDRLRVDLNAATNGLDRRRDVDEGVEEFDEGRRLWVLLVHRLDLHQLGDDASRRADLSCSTKHAVARRESTSANPTVPLRMRRQDLTLLESDPGPPSDVDAERSSWPREGGNGTDEGRFEVEVDVALEEAEEGSEGTVSLVVVEGGAGDVRIEDDLAQDSNERLDEGYFLGRHAADGRVGVETIVEGLVGSGEAGEVVIERAEEGLPGEGGRRGDVGVEGASRGEKLKGVGGAMRSRRERSHHLVVGALERRRAALGSPPKEGRQLGRLGVGSRAHGIVIDDNLLPVLEAAVGCTAVDRGDEDEEGLEDLERPIVLRSSPSRHGILLAIPQLAQGPVLGGDDFAHEHLELLGDKVLEVRVHADISSERRNLAPNPTPHRLELRVQLVPEHGLAKEGKDARIERLPHERVDELFVVLLKVGVLGGDVEEGGPLKLHGRLELVHGPGRVARDGLGDLVDERLVAVKVLEVVRGSGVGDVKGGEEGDECVDCGAVGGRGFAELGEEEEDVVGSHVSTGADEEEKLTEQATFLLVVGNAIPNLVVGEGGVGLRGSGRDEGVGRARLTQGSVELVDFLLAQVDRVNNLLHPSTLALGSRVEDHLGAQSLGELLRFLLQHLLDSTGHVGRESSPPDELQRAKKSDPLIEVDDEATLCLSF